MEVTEILTTVLALLTSLGSMGGAASTPGASLFNGSTLAQFLRSAGVSTGLGYAMAFFSIMEGIAGGTKAGIEFNSAAAQEEWVKIGR